MRPFTFFPCSFPAVVHSGRVSGTCPLPIGFCLCLPIRKEVGESEKNQFLKFPPIPHLLQRPPASSSPPKAPRLARHLSSEARLLAAGHHLPFSLEVHSLLDLLASGTPGSLWTPTSYLPFVTSQFHCVICFFSDMILTGEDPSHTKMMSGWVFLEVSWNRHPNVIGHSTSSQTQNPQVLPWTKCFFDLPPIFFFHKLPYYNFSLPSTHTRTHTCTSDKCTHIHLIYAHPCVHMCAYEQACAHTHMYIWHIRHKHIHTHAQSCVVPIIAPRVGFLQRQAQSIQLLISELIILCDIILISLR